MNLAMKAVGGGIIAVLGLVIAKALFAMLGGLFVFVIALVFKIALIALIVWLAFRLVRYFRDKPAYTD